MIGNDMTRLGWFRDDRCVPPDWPTQPVSGQTVAVDAFGDSWQIELFDPVIGKTIGSLNLTARDHGVRIVLPEFQGSIAFRMKRVAR